MVYFQTQNPNLGKFWRVLQWKMLVYFIAIWSIFRPFGIFCGTFVIFCGNLVHFPRFGILYQEKSGNPVQQGDQIGRIFAHWPIVNFGQLFEKL
jgi:hypothetical protein